MKTKIKEIIQSYIKIVQKILITILLTILYIIGFGITFIFAMIFKRRLLGQRPERNNTFWFKAEGYETNMNDSMSQS
jgi:cytochrome c biogenesis protein CcdA